MENVLTWVITHKEEVITLCLAVSEVLPFLGNKKAAGIIHAIVNGIIRVLKH